MKILLDECVDWRLVRDLDDFETKTVRQMGWTETRNGALLALAAADFGVFITVDTNLAFQQNVETLPIAVVVLHAATTRLHDLRALIPSLRSLLPTVRSGQLHHIFHREV